MDDKATTAIVSVLIAIIGVAVIATLVSQGSNTANVLTTGGSAFSQVLCKALSPVTGNSCGGTSLTPSVNSTITFG